MLGFVGSEEYEYCIERPNINAILMDMLLGSMDTSATAIEWTLSELLKNPQVMKKVQMELETVVGMQRKVKESDLDKLEYLDMVIKENMRLHPVAPLLMPHQSMEDCMVGDFFIPRKSRVVVNAWAIMRDSSAWSEAENNLIAKAVWTARSISGANKKMIETLAARKKEEYLKNLKLGRIFKLYKLEKVE
ncbi:Cytochrome P450 CYP736A12 [Glycine max]|nr:Cytochrome P450 CYP736A12 [Glycine max]